MFYHFRCLWWINVYGSQSDPTPYGEGFGLRFFPKIVGVSILIVSLIQLVAVIKKPIIESENKDKEPEDSKGGLFTIAAIVAYTILYDILGFICSTMLYLFVQIYILSNRENRNYKLFALVSVITPIVIYALFVYAIDMPLPEGILSF